MLIKQLSALLLVAFLWFFVGAPAVFWLSWNKVETEIAELETQAQRNEIITAESLCSATRRLEAQASATEKALTTVSLIAFSFLLSAGVHAWQHRVDNKARLSGS